ncbi:UNVERIFIED_CONTAM: hypothetical protein FKN15_053131 [Acipenser sinensis]
MAGNVISDVLFLVSDCGCDVMTCCFNDEGTLLAVGLTNGTIQVYQPADSTFLYQLNSSETLQSSLPVTSLRFQHRDNRERHCLLLATYASGCVRVWHVAGGRSLCCVQEGGGDSAGGRGRQTLSLSMSPSGDRFITAGSDCQLHLPTPQQLEELQLVNKNLLWISKLNRQAVGRNLASLIAARCQLWLSPVRIVDGDKAPLLDAPITPGHTFGPAVDEMLQRCHRARESTKDLVRLFPKRPPPARRPAPSWRPRFQQPQRAAQPAPAKARGGFDGDKAPLLDASITPGHTFGPAVDEMLQRCHRARESTKDLVRLFPKRPPPARRPAPSWWPRFQQPQRAAQPAPAKARGGFHNRPAAA